MRLFGLIGFPLTHSFSKKYFTDKFQQENITDCRYENFQLETIDELPRIIDSNPGLEGLNVTIPYKESVLKFLAEKNDIVAQSGACNCIRIREHRLSGFNTDVIAFEIALKKYLQPSHRQALILGTGGAAKAVAFTFKRLGIDYKFVSRHSSPGTLSYDELKPEIIQSIQVIVNTTPLGMFPRITEFPPLPYKQINAQHFLFDLTYNPEKTLFLQKGEQRGAVIENGYYMLVLQAEESWKIWNA